ncbi:putative SprT-like protease [Burkholderia phage Mica]|uniref:Putative SprT-like protease n=1 Tax=Burkholderia phage Mica TaxID=2767579 RepID=A0A873WEJ0_9CAUD|nr:putative SprT-like protease [Burkholderia phage Mica]QPB08643.1 putative SprT-like protease [Burkholderia phage Mica]
MNRETWLNEMAQRMAPRFEELGHPLPKFRVAVGWTSAGKSTKVGGECWHSKNSADGVFEILVSPIVDDSLDVAAILAHELNHAAVGFQHHHKGEFAVMMGKLGMKRPYTSSIAGPQFEAWVKPFLDELGKIPHARIMLKAPRPANDNCEGVDGDGEGDDEGGSSNQKKKQTTRMLKASCTHDVDGEPCGYTVRLSKKWAQKLGACCPAHGAMEVEGADDGPEEQDAA